MQRPFLAICALAFAAGPAAASTYSATLAGSANGQIIARDIVWTCGSNACRGATEESRPAVICQSLARQAGKIGTFLADGRPFSDSELAKCNAAAKAEGARSLAAQ